jgi:hypothetical protein
VTLPGYQRQNTWYGRHRKHWFRQYLKKTGAHTLTEETDKKAKPVAESQTAVKPAPESLPESGSAAETPQAPESKPAEVSSSEVPPKTAAEAKEVEKKEASCCCHGAPDSAPSRAPAAKERNLLAAVGTTMKHIEDCEKDRSLIFRHSDRVSLTFLFAAFAVEVLLALVFVTYSQLRMACIVMAAVADILFGLAIIWFVLLRFGILRSFEPRQTLLTWQLMIGSGALFAFYTMNIAFGFFIYYNMLIGLPPHMPQ